jgi:hypothetical protein
MHPPLLQPIAVRPRLVSDLTKTLRVTYIFFVEDKEPLKFVLLFDETTMAAAKVEQPDELPDWSRLDFHQCSHCPLDHQIFRVCPAAAHLSKIVSQLGEIPSYDVIELEVVTEERTIRQRTTMHNALSSLMGLVMATSGCPYLTSFIPMARFHLPLSSAKETIFRATSAYLLGQYFRRKAGGEFDHSLDGLARIYQDVQKVDMGFANRMRASGAIKETNAIAQLYQNAEILPFAIEDSLIELAPLFPTS